MPVIDYIDGPNRDIYLHADTVGASVHPIDIYTEMRILRRTDESLRKYDVFLTAKGKDEKGGGKYTERYVICMNGTRIVPYDTSHTLTITGVIITDDGQEGIACFDRTPLNPATIVDINYVPPQVEVIEVSSGSGLSQEEHDNLMALPASVINFDLTDYDQHGTVGAILVRSAYNGVVEVNLDSSYSGVEFPIGMKHQPVNNIPDALILLDRFHLSGLCINGDTPIPAGTNLNGVNFCSGGTIDRTILIPNTTVTTNGTKFKGIILTGTLNGRTEMKGCVLEDLVGIRGNVLDSSFSGAIGFDDSSGQTTVMARCYSSGEKGIPVFSLYDVKLSVTDWIGKGILADKTGTSYLGISCSGGVFDIAVSCVAGFIIFTGDGTVDEDLSGAGCIVADSFMLNKDNISTEVWANIVAQELINDTNFIKSIEGGRWKILDNQMLFFKKDNVTEIARFNLLDVDGNPTEQDVYERTLAQMTSDSDVFTSDMTTITVDSE